MSKHVRYRDYTIRSTPLQLVDSMQWTLAIVISWECEGTVTSRPFSADSVYATEDEADLHGVTFGQRIIDGKITGLSVD